MNRVNWIRMTRANWLSWRGRSRKKRTHYLDGRIVFCADCATNRRLTFDAGRLICSSCCSEHWMFASSGILARFKDYDEEAVHTQVVVERLTKRLKKEAFFAPNALWFSAIRPERCWVIREFCSRFYRGPLQKL